MICARCMLLSALLGMLQVSQLGNWTPVAPMPTVRFALTATTANGEIYAIGGANKNFYNLNEVYDPMSNSWDTRESMPTKRWLLASVLGPDARIYVIGGFDDKGQSLGSLEAYTPATDSWVSLTPMPTPRGGLAAAVGFDGRIYAIGGCFGTFPTCQVVDTVEAYTQSTDSWTTVAHLSTARSAVSAAVGEDGGIYVSGGFLTGHTGVTNTTEVYSIDLDSWSSAASMPTARAALAMTAGDDGLIYAVGGCTAFPCGDSDLATVEAYEPDSNTWEPVANMGTARGAVASVLGPDGRIYAIGGRSQTGVALDTVEAYSNDSAGLNVGRALPEP